MAWMPLFTERTGISYAVVYVTAGALLFFLFPAHLPSADITKMDSVVLRFSELIVIISLMGTGIKIDRRFTWKAWKVPLRMVLIGMVVNIALLFIAGTEYLGLSWTSALLLAAALSPTDPVLAGDVQVGPPNKSIRLESRFALTAEAGMNDGLAFPFVWLAVLGVASGGEVNTFNWVSYELCYKILAGIAVGFLSGKLIGYIIFRKFIQSSATASREGFLAIAFTLITYALTEAIHGYGFIAVFVFAITLRHFEKRSEYHEFLHSFTDQIERILLAIALLFFGGSVVQGVLKDLTAEAVIYSVLLLFVIRPLAMVISLLGIKISLRERIAISFFGIRGMGSVFYLAFGLKMAGFVDEGMLWDVVSFTILLSVIIHGLTATWIMRNLKKNSDNSALPA